MLSVFPEAVNQSGENSQTGRIQRWPEQQQMDREFCDLPRRRRKYMFMFSERSRAEQNDSKNAEKMDDIQPFFDVYFNMIFSSLVSQIKKLNIAAFGSQVLVAVDGLINLEFSGVTVCFVSVVKVAPLESKIKSMTDLQEPENNFNHSYFKH